MGVVVHGIDAPLVTGLVVVGFLDAVDHRVAHVDVGRRHVDLHPQHGFALIQFAGAHVFEAGQIFLHAAAAERAVLAGIFQGAAVFADLVGGEFVHIGLALFDQVNGVVVERIEIVGGVTDISIPGEAEPFHITLDGVDVFLAFFFRVGVVETQVAGAAEFLRQGKIQADGFGVAHVQVAVRLGRETGGDAAAVLAGFEVLGDDLADEMTGRGAGGCACGFAHGSVRILGRRRAK